MYNAQVNNAKDLDVILMNNLIKYRDNYAKTSGSLQNYRKDDSNYNITDFESFKFKPKFTNNINEASVGNVETAVPLKYLSNFWRTLEMLLINFEINFMLTWSATCTICEVDRVTTFAIIDESSMFQL